MANLANSPVDVTLEYQPHAHLSQIYAGFQALEAQGVVKCLWVKPTPAGAESKSKLCVTLNNEISVTYDTADGLNWIHSDWNDNLEYFHRTAPDGYYFKRSYHPDLVKVAPIGCKVLPLGLNYPVSPRYIPVPASPRQSLERLIRDSPLMRRLLKINAHTFSESGFLAAPQLRGPNRILMFTRLWDPHGADVTFDAESADRRKMNEVRIEALTACRRAFGEQFTGGLQSDSYSRTQVSPSLLLPFRATQRRAYLETVKHHSICVATTGLHRSIGFRFAEYIAASRAVVSEPLWYEIGPGFERGVNYLEFTNTESLVETISHLLADRRRVVQIMESNRRYYQAFLRPDALILRTIIYALRLSEDS